MGSTPHIGDPRPCWVQKMIDRTERSQVISMSRNPSAGNAVGLAGDPHDNDDLIDLTSRLSTSLNHLRRVLNSDTNRALESSGRTLAWYQVLYRLRSHERLSQRVLIFDAGLDPAGVSRLIGRMESEKLVTVAIDVEDRRRRLVAITEAGEKELETLQSTVHKVVGRVLGPLPVEDRRQLLKLLEAVTDRNRS